MGWQSARKQVSQEIMKTDILCEILSEDRTETEMLVPLERAFGLFREFAGRYSRFIKDNELWRLNESERCQVSPELFRILELCQEYHATTGGVFDPGILTSLEAEGYRGAYGDRTNERIPFSSLTLDPKTLTACKPLALKIDLGGIGKGFIADKVASFLQREYANFLVDAGGDIAAGGANRKESYPYWAIDVEHPFRPEQPAALLLLSDMAVATSGRNRRHWMKDGLERHHLIDPSTGKSAPSDLISVTVIAESVTRADILAKTLLIAGKARGSILADTLGIAAIMISRDKQITVNRFAEPYVWKK